MKTIILDVNGTEIGFDVHARDIEAYQDDITMQKKVVPSKRLLKATVKPESREALTGIIEEGFALDLAAALLEEYQGGLKVTVKKSSGG